MIQPDGESEARGCEPVRLTGVPGSPAAPPASCTPTWTRLLRCRRCTARWTGGPGKRDRQS